MRVIHKYDAPVKKQEQPIVSEKPIVKKPKKKHIEFIPEPEIVSEPVLPQVEENLPAAEEIKQEEVQ